MACRRLRNRRQAGAARGQIRHHGGAQRAERIEGCILMLVARERYLAVQRAANDATNPRRVVRRERLVLCRGARQRHHCSTPEQVI
jgi:hypothetical protein